MNAKGTLQTKSHNLSHRNSRFIVTFIINIMKGVILTPYKSLF